MNNNHIQDRIQEYLDGELPVEEEVIIRNHIASCDDCAREITAMEKLLGSLRALPAKGTLPVGFLEESDRMLREAFTNSRKNGTGSGISNAEISNPEDEVRGSKFEVRNPRSEVGNQRSEVGGRRSEIGGQKSEIDRSNFERRTSNFAQNYRWTFAIAAMLLLAVGSIFLIPKLRNTEPKIAELKPAPKNAQAPLQEHTAQPSVASPVEKKQNITTPGTITEQADSPTLDNHSTPTAVSDDTNKTTKAAAPILAQAKPDRETVRNDTTRHMTQQVIRSQYGKLTGKKELLITADRMVNEITTSAGVEVAQPKAGGAANQPGNSAVGRGAGSGTRSYSGGSKFLKKSPYFVPPQQSWNTEEYNNFTENEFLDAAGNPLSTFSIDVDAASYTNMRRYLNDGQKPPKDAVRIEELINYFKYDYPQPEGNEPFSVTTDAAQCPWNKDHTVVLVGLQGRQIATENLPPSNLVFLLDVSGSMDEPNKLPLVKAAFRLLVKQLRRQDRVAIVTYAGNAGLALPSTPGNDKEKILDAIDRLEAGGSTAGGAGIQLAYKIAKENFTDRGNNRVILATDGDFNVGVSSESDLVQMIEERRNDGIFLTVLGFGMGNYKDNKMQKLADKGNGNNFYIDNVQEARRVFISQMAGTLFTIAKDVKIQVEFNPAQVKAYRLIGYEKRLLKKEDFNDDTKDAGELGSGTTVTALYEIVPANGSIDLPSVDPLKYQDNSRKKDGGNYSDEMLTVKLRYKEPTGNKSKLITKELKQGENQEIGQASENLRFASGVVEFGMLLRDSKFKGTSSFASARQLAESAKGYDPEGYRSEFVRIIEIAKSLWGDEGK